MISWFITVLLGVVVARIIWVEIKDGRKSRAVLAETSQQIEVIKKNAIEGYRAKFGKDPTAPYPVVDIKAASKP